MRPIDLSEFSFGYALTESLIKGLPHGLTAAPLFPSLKKEGQPGGGYDLKLSFQGFILFLQFKLSDRMERSTAKEAKDGVLETPFFRMHLRSSAKSDQHQLLLDLEGGGNTVFYAAPEFSTAVELDEAYLADEVVAQTVFIRPSDIKALPDQKEHWVAFKKGNSQGYFFSPQGRALPAGAILTGERFLKTLARTRPRSRVTADLYNILLDKMQSAILDEVERRQDRPRYQGATEGVEERQAPRLKAQFEKMRSQRRPDEAVAYLSRTFFGAEAIRIERFNKSET